MTPNVKDSLVNGLKITRMRIKYNTYLFIYSYFIFYLLFETNEVNIKNYTTHDAHSNIILYCIKILGCSGYALDETFWSFQK